MISIEGFEDLQLIGAGGFADVHRAYEPAYGRDVALKVFRARVHTDDRSAFEREAQAMGRLSGIRNVVQVYHGGVTADGNPYLAMELMHGSMEDLLERGPLPVATVCAVGVSIGAALAEAHSRSVLHRDLKPANILIDRYGDPRLSDFGISSLSESGASRSVAGFTAEHAPPEVFEAGRSSPAGDLYSLASTLVTMIDGTAPFVRGDDEGPLAFMRRVQERPVPSSAAARAVAPELDELLRAAMAKEPLDRPSLATFVEGLRPFAGTADRQLDATASVGRPTPSGGPRTEDPPVPPGPAADDSGAAGRTPSRAGVAGTAGTRRAGTAGRRGPIAAVVALVLLAGGLLWMQGRSGADPGDGERSAATASTASPSTSTEGPDASDPGPVIPDGPGVSAMRPLPRPGVEDSSPTLRSRIDAFAAASDDTALRTSTPVPLGAREIQLGVPPSRFDYLAENSGDAPDCRRLFLQDLVALGVAGSWWAGDGEVVLVNVVQMESELQARQYFWAMSLFLGLDAGQCSGWPADGVAVDPDDLTVARQDFALEVRDGDVVTAIDRSPPEELMRNGIAYDTTFWVDDLVVVASAGYTTTGRDETALVEVLQELADALSE